MCFVKYNVCYTNMTLKYSRDIAVLTMAGEIVNALEF